MPFSKFAVPEKHPILSTNIGEDVWICEPCVGFKKASLPDSLIVDMIFEKHQHDDFAKEVASGLQIYDQKAPPGNPMWLNIGTQVGSIVEDVYELKTYAEIVTGSKKTPQQLNCKPYHRLLPNGKRETKYAMPPEGPGVQIVVLRMFGRVFLGEQGQAERYEQRDKLKPIQL